MLKKMFITAVAGAAMLAITGNAHAAIGDSPPTSAPAMQIASTIAPKTFKIAGKHHWWKRYQACRHNYY